MNENVLKVYDSAFSQDFIDTFLQYNSAPTWKICHDSCYNDLDDIEFFSKTCVDEINKLTETKHTLYRCYRHALFSNSQQKAHYDVNADRTFLVWMHPHWDILWGGQLRVGDNLETHIDCFPNRAVYFSADHNQHYVAPNCSDTFRITYIWKLKTV